ncbi:hypothetical protein DXG01_002567 [Tephrocybe rancida]|nr:hypothetical protein DXG01_002567 [Tephrocybe rancida]
MWNTKFTTLASSAFHSFAVSALKVFVTRFYLDNSESLPLAQDLRRPTPTPTTTLLPTATSLGQDTSIPTFEAIVLLSMLVVLGFIAGLTVTLQRVSRPRNYAACSENAVHSFTRGTHNLFEGKSLIRRDGAFIRPLRPPQTPDFWLRSLQTLVQHMSIKYDTYKPEDVDAAQLGKPHEQPTGLQPHPGALQLLDAQSTHRILEPKPQNINTAAVVTRLEDQLDPSSSQIIASLREELKTSRARCIALEANLTSLDSQLRTQTLDLRYQISEREALITHLEGRLEAHSSQASIHESTLKAQIEYLLGRLATLEENVTTLETQRYQRILDLESQLCESRALTTRILEADVSRNNTFSAALSAQLADPACFPTISSDSMSMKEAYRQMATKYNEIARDRRVMLRHVRSLEARAFPPDYPQIENSAPPSYGQSIQEGAVDEWSASIITAM